MKIPNRFMTVEEFDAWILTLNSSDPDYEYIAGEVVEKNSGEPVSKAESEIEFQLLIKAINAVMAGKVVWVIRPKTKTVEIYDPKQPIKVLRMGDSIDGGTVLPNFHLALKDIFER